VTAESLHVEQREGLTVGAARRLVVVGAAALFWELALIRWLGSCIRIVSYYTNLVLIAAFLGLGAGALLARRGRDFARWLLPSLCFVVAMAPFLGSFIHSNPAGTREFVWIGAPLGVQYNPLQEYPLTGLTGVSLPYWLLILFAYLAVAGVFLMFGEWLGRLFGRLPPLRAYSAEIGGSLLGVLLFALVSWLNLPPPLWFAAGFALVLSAVDVVPGTRRLWALLAILVTVGTYPFSSQFLWSRYYKIATQPLDIVWDVALQQRIRFHAPIGRIVSVNNDYHQMILDLRPRTQEHAFLASWRWLYDLPYPAAGEGPSGPTLILGAGTGNDVSAALRAGRVDIDAVEIDPAIVALGRRYHPEAPYQDPRVHVVVDDARSFFTRTARRYALVVFGFLDSHRLTSSFSSVRIDNFVYTRDAMEQVKRLLLPGGTVVVTFASSTPWMDERMQALLDSVFDRPTRAFVTAGPLYANGVVYVTGRAASAAAPSPPRHDRITLPTDDWPYLYLPRRAIPPHYAAFIVLVVISGAASLLILRPGERRVRLPYFFMGAGFFLLETSNVVSLSLLYGSTWIVNVTVFAGILLLILLANLTCARRPDLDLRILFAALLASVAIAYLVPVSTLLPVRPALLQAALAAVVFLAPVYFAGLIFARLIDGERDLAPVYGSNLLGAVIGGSCEYLSILLGLKALLIVTFAFYLLALATLVGRTSARARPV
jgi:spermidine synthase